VPGKPRRPTGDTVAIEAVGRSSSAGVCYAPQAIPWLVGLTITAAYRFTSSTSFANPAVRLAHGFTMAFAGIAINYVPGFIAAQLIGAAVAAATCAVLFSPRAGGFGKAVEPGK
jgi:glycerol uptake facilitator-like aquaporin